MGTPLWQVRCSRLTREPIRLFSTSKPDVEDGRNFESFGSVNTGMRISLDRVLVKRLLIAVSIVAVLVAVRVGLEPKMGPLNVIKVAPNERPAVKTALAASAVDRSALVAELARKRVLLVGEQHFQQEPQSWLRALLADLQAMDGRSSVLVLELPQRTQPYIDRYLSTGDESALNHAFSSKVLPYRPTVRWAREHPEAVASIRVDDESFWHIGLMRLLLTDTRNDTMARAVAAAAEANPGKRIVVYGGRMHMMKAGRYMYNSNTRRPIGARLPTLGIPAQDIAAVWLFAGENPFDGLWDTPGAVRSAGPAGDLPLVEIEEYPIYGVTRIKQIADYAVQLGPATPIQQ